MAYDLPLGTDNGDVAILTKIAGSLEALRKNEPGFVTTGGSANAYTATFAPAHALATDAVFYIRINVTNTGGSTLNVNGTGVKNLMKIQGASFVALAPGDVIANGIYQVIRDQTGDRYLVLAMIGNSIRIPKPSPLYAKMFHDLMGPSLTANTDVLGYSISAGTTIAQVDERSGVQEITANNGIGSIITTSSAFKALTTSERVFDSYMATGSTGTTQKRVVCGLMNGSISNMNAAGTGRGCFFRVEAAGSAVNIFAVTKNGADLETITDTGVLDGAAFHEFEIIATSSQVKYYLDEVLMATHSTNIPTVMIGSRISIFSLEAVDKKIRIDWIDEVIQGGRPT